MEAERFTQVFRDEHRKIRDLLPELIEAFKARDPERIRPLLGQTATATGPHFRYEEEILYPALVELLGKAYMEQLLREHDRAIETAKRLTELASRETLSDSEVAEAVELIRGMLPHVSDCDGLSLMVEKLPAPKVQEILAAREHSLREGMGLSEWAKRLRTRPLL